MTVDPQTLIHFLRKHISDDVFEVAIRRGVLDIVLS